MGNVKPALQLPGKGQNSQAVTSSRVPPAPDLSVERYRPPANRLEFNDYVQSGSVLDYWRVIARHRFTLLLLAVAGALAALLVTLSLSPVYRARTRIEIEDLNQEFMNMKQVSPLQDSSSVNALNDMQTQIQILQSENLIERTLNRLKISSLPALDPPTTTIARWFGKKAAPGRSQVVDAATRDLKVSVAGQTRIIEITFQSTDPKIASGFANTLASEFIQQNMQVRLQSNKSTSQWLSREVSDLRNNVRRSDAALQAYARQKGLIYTANKENVSTEKLRQIQAEVSQAQADRALKESRFEVARRAAPDTLADVVNDSNLRNLQANLTSLRRQEAELSTTFKPEYSKARRVHAEIEVLEAALQRERAAIVSRIANDNEEAAHRANLLGAAYDSQVGRVMKDSQDAIQYEILKREVDSNRQIYETMLQRVKESSITSALKPSNIRVVDEARTPEKPFKPNLPLNSAAGLAGGLLVGLVGVVVFERGSRKLHQPGDAGRMLGLRELGVIPSAGWTSKSADTAALRFYPEERRKAARSKLVAWQSMPVGVADSFRAVLASIILSRDKDRQSVFVITSARPGEGKTTAATNLTVALAKIGQKVLLIDCNTRKPCVHEAFGLGNSGGVTDLLSAGKFDAAAADAAVRETDLSNVYVLTSGPALSSGCDLLFTTSMPRLIAYYREKFDMIIIDTPPLLNMPDARVLGRMADAVVLVAWAGRTLRQAAFTAADRLAQDRTPVLGIILNDWDPKSSTDDYYGE